MAKGAKDLRGRYSNTTMVSTRLNLFNFILLALLAAGLYYAALYSGSPQQTLMPSVKIPAPAPMNHRTEAAPVQNAVDESATPPSESVPEVAAPVIETPTQEP